MSIRNRLSAAMPFAQLLGLHPHAEEEDREKDESRKARRAEEDDDEKDDLDAKGRKAKGRRAEDDDLEDEDDKKDARRARGEEGDPDDEDEPKGKKARRAEDDDDADPDAEDDDEDPKSKKAIVGRERARCAAIVAHGFKSGNAEQACVFAFDTNMSAAAAVSALNAAGKVSGRGSSLQERMSAAKVPHAGAGGGSEVSADASPIARQIIAAAARAQGL
ncbi:hypothetical protein NJH78_05275 [Pseudomonas chlororaphis]|uniref:hypothetical protein n=1 Tax=Pseudomonas chlororaphis TaxID=587753 RepID=UPI00209AF6AA|nr:hypothetical protein [Pseudomonas chlororaphis]MCO7569377.1 hypothetical protein [Pseudomonas chlororaphis]MCO7586778.1 hypothetical protein [Pseudomonas chlororaphis]